MSSSIPMVPPAALLPGLPEQLGYPSQHRAWKHFSREIRDVIWRTMYLLDKSPGPDPQQELGNTGQAFRVTTAVASLLHVLKTCLKRRVNKGGK